ncbi:peptidase M42, partial [Bacillus haynesii]|nr:peptidase M42 [Bacillus haynesii]
MSGQKTMELIKELVSIPSPTGNTYDIIDYINRLLQKVVVETRLNRQGGLIATIPGRATSRLRLLSAH